MNTVAGALITLKTTNKQDRSFVGVAVHVSKDKGLRSN